MNEKIIPTYELYDGINATVIRIRELLMQRKRPDERVVVFIAGGSSSGKSTQVANKIAENLGIKEIIRADNYYRGAKYMREHGMDNWDEPRAVNLTILYVHIQQLLKGESIPKLQYSFIEGEAIPDGKIQPERVILVEGLFIFEDIVKDLAHLKVFVDAGMHDRFIRRVLRDIERSGQKPVNILRQFAAQVNPSHELYIESKKQFADIIIKNEYSPSQIPPEKSGLREFQLKFFIGWENLDYIERRIRKLQVGWGEHAAKLVDVRVQCDTYYNPPNQKLIETGEMLRIREEYDAYDKVKRILTFKVIWENEQFIERITPIEFELGDEETANLFLSLYKDTAKIVRKRRRLYTFQDGTRFGGLSFTLDNIFFEKYQPTWYLEVRFKKGDEKKIEELVEDYENWGLGLKMADAIKRSYFEM